MVIKNVELVHECSLEHLRMGTIMKGAKVTVELGDEGKQSIVNMERNKVVK